MARTRHQRTGQAGFFAECQSLMRGMRVAV
jgi:hypothetical protein